MDKEKDKERYLISILGEQKLDGETDKIEVLTAGNFMKRKDHYYIGYKEYDEDDLNIGVFTKTLKNNLTSKGGSLEVSYTLDFNTDLVSENRFLITIEEKQNTVR